MALLAQQTKEDILYRLGYNSADQAEFSEQLDLDYFSVTAARIAEICTELDNVDTKITASLEDSMAVKVDDIGVDFRQHYRHLLHEGHRLLGELSSLVVIPIGYDKYLNCGQTVTSGTDTIGSTQSNSFYSYY